MLISNRYNKNQFSFFYFASRYFANIPQLTPIIMQKERAIHLVNNCLETLGQRYLPDFVGALTMEAPTDQHKKGRGQGFQEDTT